jgi:hypothetical protein
VGEIAVFIHLAFIAKGDYRAVLFVTIIIDAIATAAMALLGY